MKKFSNLYFLGVIIPAVIAFKAFFMSGSLVWGDAPYFFPEYIKIFVGEPSVWVSWGKLLGGISDVVWIHPLMFLWGVFSKYFNINTDIAIRLIFYFPAVILSIISPIFLTRYLGYSKTIQFFTSLFYVFNTYFILLVDGGQVGVALSYSLFPLVLMFLLRMTDRPDVTKFYQAVLFFMLMIATDLRIAAICLLTFIIWPKTSPSLINVKRRFKILFLFCLVILGLNLYWVMPTIGLLSKEGGIAVSQLELNSLLNSFFLFQPHWYLNQYGKVTSPYFYFVGIPILIFCSLLNGKRKNLLFALCFLVFAFLAKGTTPPLGFVYEWFINHVPFGFAFRDSTKFFIPLLLIGGILIGLTIRDFANRVGRWVIPVLYLYMLFLVYPVFSGNMHGVLLGRQFDPGVDKINQLIQGSNGFLRTAWFPEKNPLAYHSEEKQSIDARDLINLRPIASLNLGRDPFNYMHQSSEYIDWFGLLGVRYLIFSGDPHVVNPTQEDKDGWEDLTSNIATNSSLIREGTINNIPVYGVANTKPHAFVVKKVLIILGSENIYQKIRQINSQFSVSNQAFLFLEDGKLDPKSLQNIDSSSATLIFNGKDEKDLVPSFLQKYFIDPNANCKSQWATRSSQDYLNWRYEFLLNGVDTREFDYNKGVAFSSKKGETIEFDKSVNKQGKYMFVVRSLSNETGDSLNVNLNGEYFKVKQDRIKEFSWFEKEVYLNQGKQKLIIENRSSFSSLNTFAFIPENEWVKAKDLMGRFVSHFQILKESDLNLLDYGDWKPLDFSKLGTLKYSIQLPENSWLIYTDTYNKSWQVSFNDKISPSVPMYSIINGFYTGSGGKAVIYFKGQDYLKWGLIGSVFVLIIASVVLFRLKKHE